MEQWIPNYIKKNISYKAHEILSAKEYNAILNLIITQGDYNSAWLDYLQNHGIPDAVSALNVEIIKEAVTKTVEAELDTLAASVINKTSAYLNNPVFSIVNLSVQRDALTFRELLESSDVTGTFCIATNLIDKNATYPTATDIERIVAAGYELLPVGVDGSSLNTVTEADAKTIASRTKEYISAYGVTPNVFVYPGGIDNADAVKGISTQYKFGLNPASIGAFDSDAILDNMHNISVVYVNSDKTLADITAVVNDTIIHNKYCVIVVDTSLSTYSEELLSAVIAHIKETTYAVITSVGAAAELCYNTINNKLEHIGRYIDAIIADISKIIDTDVARLETGISGIRVDITDINDSLGVVDEALGVIDDNIAAIDSNIDDIKEALSGKQDKLPDAINDKYLHTNESTGELEWGIIIPPTWGNVTGKPFSTVGDNLTVSEAGVISADVSKAEVEAISKKVSNTSDAWEQRAYKVGEYVFYNNVLWKCIRNTTSSPSEPDWEQTSITNELGGVRTGVDENGKCGYYEVGADTFHPFNAFWIPSLTLYWDIANQSSSMTATNTTFSLKVSGGETLTIARIKAGSDVVSDNTGSSDVKRGGKARLLIYSVNIAAQETKIAEYSLQSSADHTNVSVAIPSEASTIKFELISRPPTSGTGGRTNVKQVTITDVKLS